MIKILIVSDIKIYREGLRQILSAKNSTEVIAAVSCSHDDIAPYYSHRPHVVLLDMTSSTSCEIATEISQLPTPVAVVALGVGSDEPNIVSYAKAGISCYVSREASVDELMAAIKDAAQGECHCPPEIAGVLLNTLRTAPLREVYQPDPENKNETHVKHAAASIAEGQAFYWCLTPRERQVIGLLAEGQSNKQISRTLCIELSTVKNHVHNLLIKLKAKNRAHAAYLLQASMAEIFDSASISREATEMHFRRSNTTPS
ncbi:LuxR C-terminal-related transcriptional regulator [Teredinibacter turnerae]|uniref:LuxR C-terminal-related transcriptional regulator n=1 Tax=Teredinibacter turnerae TaxID=2426 RepID=UPI000382D238|nr:response regulator transcription factor [Teredinibacter turnerae]